VQRLKASKTKATVKKDAGIGGLIHLSPRTGSTVKTYNVKDLFKAQSNGTKIDFDTAPSQWQDDMRNPIIHPIPKKRGRPRKDSTSTVPSPVVTRVSAQEKRKLDSSPARKFTKRLKPAATSHNTRGVVLTHRQYSVRKRTAPTPADEVNETEAESEVEYATGPSADQEEELPIEVDESIDEQSSKESTPKTTTLSPVVSEYDPPESHPEVESLPQDQDDLNDIALSRIDEEDEETQADQPKTPEHRIIIEEGESEAEAENDAEQTQYSKKKSDERQSKTLTRQPKSRLNNKAQAIVDDIARKVNKSSVTKDAVEDKNDSNMGNSAPCINGEHDQTNHIDLDRTLAEIVVPLRLQNSEAIEIVNELLAAGRKYQEDLESVGFLVDSEPIYLEGASRSLKSLYHKIVCFITHLEDEPVLMDGEVPPAVWDQYQMRAIELRSLVSTVMSKSVSRLFAYGIFSMIPLIAVSTRFHLSLQSPNDVAQSLDLLQSILKAYDTLHMRARNIKSGEAEKSSHAIYKPAIAFRGHIRPLVDYVKAGLKKASRDRIIREQQQNQAEADVIQARRDRQKTLVDQFDLKRNRLLALWNGRQEQEVDFYLRYTKFGSKQVSEYWKGAVQPDGYVLPVEEFDFNKLGWSLEEINCLTAQLKKFHGMFSFILSCIKIETDFNRSWI
jgi:hypothetical protein